MLNTLFFPLHRWKPGEAWNAEGVIECWQGNAGTANVECPQQRDQILIQSASRQERLEVPMIIHYHY